MQVNLEDRLAVLKKFREALQSTRKGPTAKTTAASIEEVISNFKLPPEMDTPETREAIKKLAMEAAKNVPDGTMLTGMKIAVPRKPPEIFEQIELLEATDKKCKELEHHNGQVYVAGAVAALQWVIGLDDESPLKKLAGALRGGCGDPTCENCGDREPIV